MRPYTEIGGALHPTIKKAPQVDQTCGVFYKREGGEMKK